MNASATIRSAYIRASIINSQEATTSPRRDLQARPANEDKLRNFNAVNHLQYRQDCEKERVHFHEEVDIDVEKASIARPDDSNGGSFMLWDDEQRSLQTRLRKLVTVFPFRDPIYLVAITFALGSLDLVINAFFDLLPALFPSLEFENDEEVAIPATVLIGSIFFFAAGIFDTFGALNADRGVLETQKGTEDEMEERVVYKPALLGSPDFQWLPPLAKFVELASTNLAFQAGLIVLFGGIVFMFAGIVDFPGIVDEASPYFALVVFGPQVAHGLLFLVANAMLAISAQDTWWRPKVNDADWFGAVLNALGGLGFMVAGMFLFEGEEGRVGAGVAALAGSWAFLWGSLVRVGVVLEVY